MTRPRVLMLTVGLGTGGAEQLILMTAPRLRAAGFDVRVAALKGRGPIADELDALQVPCAVFGGRGVGDLIVLRRLLAFLRAEPVDILHAHLFLANVAARLVGRLAGVPVVITAHHDTDVWMRWHHRLIERITAPLSDRVVACSEAVRLHAIARYGLPPAQVLTLRNAIAIPDEVGDLESRRRMRRALGAGDGDLLVGTLGRLHEPKKGLHVFLRAAADVAREVPAARFVLVGDGPHRRVLERQAEGLGLGARTTFAGERRDVAAVLPAFDLFVLPSIWEGFGITLLEAMAARRPIVASRVGGVPELIRDGQEGVLVPPGDATALARAMVRVLHDPSLASRLGDAGRRRVETEFDIGTLVRDTAALYRELLAPLRGASTAAGRAA